MKPQHVAAFGYEAWVYPTPKLPHQDTCVSVAEHYLNVHMPLRPTRHCVKHWLQLDGFLCAEIVNRSLRHVLNHLDQPFCFHLLQAFGQKSRRKRGKGAADLVEASVLVLDFAEDLRRPALLKDLASL